MENLTVEYKARLGLLEIIADKNHHKSYYFDDMIYWIGIRNLCRYYKRYRKIEEIVLDDLMILDCLLTQYNL